MFTVDVKQQQTNIEQDVKSRVIHPFITVVRKNTYFTIYLSPLEGYLLTLYNALTLLTYC